MEAAYELTACRHGHGDHLPSHHGHGGRLFTCSCSLFQSYLMKLSILCHRLHCGGPLIRPVGLLSRLLGCGGPLLRPVGLLSRLLGCSGPLHRPGGLLSHLLGCGGRLLHPGGLLSRLLNCGGHLLRLGGLQFHLLHPGFLICWLRPGPLNCLIHPGYLLSHHSLSLFPSMNLAPPSLPLILHHSTPPPLPGLFVLFLLFFQRSIWKLLLGWWG
ncbi:uncharacterized protein LOC113095097 [Carassius auratus]|uniref:Uncharacterized protein LOC113095097 n=1 Tax=Carassius auratus TaxID=7957 RepID=A0A6P6P5R6_CARAU|nr:uncharacterized protein LOC113095097 [Carassius auratus]